MSKFDLLEQTLLGNLDVTIPVSLWRHFPNKDRTPEGLAAAEQAFHRVYDHDVVKISFHGRYPVVDWGCMAVYDGAISGSTTCSSCVIEQSSDWEVLEPLDVNSGELGKQVRAVEIIREYAHGRVPTLATIFDAPMVASKLCYGTLTQYINEYPDVMKSVLEMINNVMIDFGRATLEAGADGVFIASQHSTRSTVSDEQYDEFVYPFDNKLVSALRGKARYVVMHLHAQEQDDQVRFQKIANTPGIDALNWEDQTAWPSLREGKKLSRKAVFGGIDHNNILRTGTPDDVKAQIQKTAQDASLQGLVFAPGCVITVDTPQENIAAVANAVRSLDPFEFE
ncbi:MAG: uroporphyrinogen decarboxylase family protein [Candidatus Thorarchaeota archaeon]|jgi:uroporphyrinogen decarboxylase